MRHDIILKKKGNSDDCNEEALIILSEVRGTEYKSTRDNILNDKLEQKRWTLNH